MKIFMEKGCSNKELMFCGPFINCKGNSELIDRITACLWKRSERSQDTQMKEPHFIITVSTDLQMNKPIIKFCLPLLRIRWKQNREHQGTPESSVFHKRKNVENSPKIKLSTFHQLCGRWDLNPHERNAHKILSLARLPVPTLPQEQDELQHRFLILSTLNFKKVKKIRRKYFFKKIQKRC